jgi:hypothetical protein
MSLASSTRSDCRPRGFTVFHAGKPRPRIYILCMPAVHWCRQCRPGDSTTRSRRSSWFILDNTPTALEKEPDVTFRGRGSISGLRLQRHPLQGGRSRRVSTASAEVEVLTFPKNLATRRGVCPEKSLEQIYRRDRDGDAVESDLGGGRLKKPSSPPQQFLVASSETWMTNFELSKSC